MYRTSDHLMGFIFRIKYEEFQTENVTAMKKFQSIFNFDSETKTAHPLHKVPVSRREFIKTETMNITVSCDVTV
jgi:hypothetical protein